MRATSQENDKSNSSPDLEPRKMENGIMSKTVLVLLI